MQINEVLDCQACGACCTNPEENRREGFTSYIQVDPRSRLVKDKRLVVLDEAGDYHMRLDPAGRCVALKGSLGVKVSCRVYAERHRGCRLVEAGNARCLLARAERGIR